LMHRYWPMLARGITGGFADWYKRKLMSQAFMQDGETHVPQDANATTLLGEGKSNVGMLAVDERGKP